MLHKKEGRKLCYTVRERKEDDVMGGVHLSKANTDSNKQTTEKSPLTHTHSHTPGVVHSLLPH
jgi:hypothetical protein